MLSVAWQEGRPDLENLGKGGKLTKNWKNLKQLICIIVSVIWHLWLSLDSSHWSSVIFVNENKNGEKRENNEFVNEN